MQLEQAVRLVHGRDMRAAVVFAVAVDVRWRPVVAVFASTFDHCSMRRAGEPPPFAARSLQVRPEWVRRPLSRVTRGVVDGRSAGPSLGLLVPDGVVYDVAGVLARRRVVAAPAERGP